jgi:cation:H+ antiporter
VWPDRPLHPARARDVEGDGVFVNAELGLGQWVVVFALSSAVLVLAGTRLARAGDAIATETGLGGLLVGMVLVAAATSLPEIVTDVSAALAGSPSLAVGDLFGSSMANMAILAVVDLSARRRVWPAVELGHASVAAIAMALTSLAVLGIVIRPDLRIGWVGLDTIAIALLYVAAVAWIRRSRRAGRTEAEAGVADIPMPGGWGESVSDRRNLRGDLLRFSVAALVILGSAPVVAISGKGIAEAAGLSATFVGAAMLAIVTSLPELVSSLAAARMGAHDLAVGNLFGSNAVNMAILVVVDAAYTPGPLLAAVTGAAEIAAGVGAILLMTLALAAIVYGAETRIGRLEPDAVLLLLVYLGTLVAVWATSSAAVAG